MMEEVKTKLILIEGIPGSGKTTYAKRINEFLLDRHITTQMYSEGDLHPADLSWCAYLSITEYDNLLKRFPEHKLLIRNNAKVSKDSVAVAYTRLGFYPNQNELMTYLASKEIFDGKVSSDVFMDINKKRWLEFGLDAVNKNDVNIFECVFFQNNICELLFHNNMSKDKIIEYLVQLIEPVKHLNPVLIYLSQTSIEETINRVSEKRRSNDKTKYKDWIDLVINYIENSPYGKKHKLNGFNGVIKALTDRKNLELDIIKEIPIQTYVIENEEYDWDKVFEVMKNKLANHI